MHQAVREADEISARIEAAASGLVRMRDTHQTAVNAELVVGQERIATLLNSMSSLAQEEIISMHPGVVLSPNELAKGRHRNRSLPEGVAMRTIHLTPMSRVPHGAAHLRSLVESGMSVRLANALPFRLIVVDRHWAMVPAPDVEDEVALLLFRGGSMVKLLTKVFEHCWLMASPVLAAEDNGGGELSPQQRVMLRAMASGMKDEAVARELGVSIRTYRRLLANLMELMGVESRFQAGAKAMSMGWLD
ncbi:helix-turn-helix transcriptional regulator [Streptomyces viridochromogenes]|uniref:helix-turn-helix transcriptional regulator n=1 Tax=Streptomyces viridochromogenes TaxID=1938 RepID=UPI00065C9DBC|nr:helix-turn-helix transcriptional regulator [Streptomyces viridochromogenes]